MLQVRILFMFVNMALLLLIWSADGIVTVAEDISLLVHSLDNIFMKNDFKSSFPLFVFVQDTESNYIANQIIRRIIQRKEILMLTVTDFSDEDFNGCNNNKLGINIEQILWFTNSLNEVLEAQLFFYRETVIWNPSTMILLVITSAYYCDENIDISTMSFGNFVIFSLCKDQVLQFHMHMLQHFYNYVSIKPIRNHTEIFKAKYTNLNGSEIYLGIFDEEVKVHLQLNKKLDYKRISERKIKPYIQKFNATLRITNTLENYHVSAITNNLMKNYKCTENIYSEFYYDVQCLKIVVPKADRIPQYLNIIKPFTKQTWLMYFLSIPVLTFLCKITLRKLPTKHTESLEVVRMMFTGATNIQPRIYSTRIFITCILLYSLIMLNSYQGSLTSYLTIPQYYTDIATFKDLRNSKLKIVFYDAMKGYLLADSVDNEGHFRGYVRSFAGTFSDAMNYIAFDKNCSVITSEEYAVFLEQSPYYRAENMPLIHIMDECYMRILFVHKFRKDFPLVKQFDQIESILIESGFFWKWHDEVKYLFYLAEYSMEQVTFLKPLTKSHIQTPFYLLVFGFFFGVIAIFGEIIRNKYF